VARGGVIGSCGAGCIGAGGDAPRSEDVCDGMRGLVEGKAARAGMCVQLKVAGRWLGKSGCRRCGAGRGGLCCRAGTCEVSSCQSLGRANGRRGAGRAWGCGLASSFGRFDLSVCSRV
jgi:hypothetical protein